MFVLIPLGIIMLAGVIFLAVSKQSSFTIRIAALIALAMMILTVIICLFLIFWGGGQPTDDSVFFVPDAPPPPPEPEGNIMVLAGFIIFLVALFVAVLFISLREGRKSGK